MTRAVFVMVALSVSQLGCQRMDSPAAVQDVDARFCWFEDVTERMGLTSFTMPVPSGIISCPSRSVQEPPCLTSTRMVCWTFTCCKTAELTPAPPIVSTSKYPAALPGCQAKSGVDIDGHNMGVAVGDVNNDGWPDVLVTQYLGARLFLNNRNGTFTDISRQAGINNPSWGTSAAFFDFDRDGWLDLVVVNYVDYDPTWPCRDVLMGNRTIALRRPFKGVSVACSIISAASRIRAVARRRPVRLKRQVPAWGPGRVSRT